MYNDKTFTHEKLLERGGQCSLYDMCIYNHLLLTCKVILGSDLLEYLRDTIRLRSSVKDLHARLMLACEQAHVWGVHNSSRRIASLADSLFAARAWDFKGEPARRLGSYRLEIPRVNTTTHGLHSFRYSAVNRWNDLDKSV